MDLAFPMRFASEEDRVMGSMERCGIRIEPSYGAKMNSTQWSEVKYVYVGDDENREITLVLGDDSF